MSTDTHTLSGAYALDALGPEERAEFRKHLAVCEACCAEVRELRSAAALMGQAEAERPPAALKSRLLAEVARTPQQPPLKRDEPEEPRGNVVPMQGRARRWVPRLALAAAAFLIAGVGAVALNGTDDPTQPPADQLSAAAAEVFDAEDARILTVRTKNGGRLTVGISPDLNEMAVDTRQLPPLASGKAYQIWSIHKGAMTSAAVLTSLEEGAAMKMPAAETQVAITIEPATGSEAPTTEPIIIVDPYSV